MSVGSNIKKYRKLRGMTQQQLADKVGCTDAAVRNYETGARALKGATLEKVAKALEVDPAVLRPNQINTANDFLYVVLQIEDSLGLLPVESEDGTMSIGFDHRAAKSPKVQSALKTWQRQRSAFLKGDISQDDYELWKSNLGL